MINYLIKFKPLLVAVSYCIYFKPVNVVSFESSKNVDITKLTKTEKIKYAARGVKDPDHLVDRFLIAIKALESNNCTKTTHKLISSGIHAGHRAIGCYGLMPNTINELSSKYGIKLSKIPYNGSFYELKLARLLAIEVLLKSNLDPYKAAYRWLHGHNLPDNRVTDEVVNKSKYVNKFRLIF